MEKFSLGNSKQKKIITKMISQILKKKPLDLNNTLESRKAMVEVQTTDSTRNFLKLFQNQKKYVFN